MNRRRGANCCIKSNFGPIRRRMGSMAQFDFSCKLRANYQEIILLRA
jgi:hypothetical protein